jgi:REP element-mobilizing transposase RayT
MPTPGRARSPNAPQGPQRRRPDDGANGRLGEAALSQDRPQWKKLPHDIPPWVKDDAIYFLTLCTVPQGDNHLCHPDIFQRLYESVVHREALGQSWVPLLLLMPDHLYMLVSFNPVPSVVHAVSAWKRYTARYLGIAWQSDFYEHRLRRDESFVEKANYIRLNPVRAGLVSEPEAWPYVRDMTR